MEPLLLPALLLELGVPLGFGSVGGIVEVLVGIIVVPVDRRVLGGAPQRALNQLRHSRNPRGEDFRVLRRLGRQPVAPQAVGQAIDRRLDVLPLHPQRR